jgi:lysophospholipase L1-like esterase
MKRTIIFGCTSLLLLLFMPASSFACADIDGLVDINCDQQLIIAGFGDSITFGRADSPIEIGYPGRLNQYFPNAVVLNFGDPGERTPSGVRRSSRVFSDFPDIDYVVVLEGVNDFFLEDRSSSATRDNVLTIAARASNTGAISLVGNLTAIARDDQRGWVSLVNSRLAPHRHINFFSLGEGILSGDHLHPNAAGYDAMALLVANTLPIYSESNRPVDTDGDGIYDFAEVKFGTDIFNPDTDGDTLLDGAEVFIHKSSPLLLDSDNDGLSDKREVTEIGSDPADPRPGTPTITDLEFIIN